MKVLKFVKKNDLKCQQVVFVLTVKTLKLFSYPLSGGGERLIKQYDLKCY